MRSKPVIEKIFAIIGSRQTTPTEPPLPRRRFCAITVNPLPNRSPPKATAVAATSGLSRRAISRSAIRPILRSAGGIRRPAGDAGTTGPSGPQERAAPEGPALPVQRPTAYTAYGSLPVIVIAGELKPSNVSA